MNEQLHKRNFLSRFTIWQLSYLFPCSFRFFTDKRTIVDITTLKSAPHKQLHFPIDLLKARTFPFGEYIQWIASFKLQKPHLLSKLEFSIDSYAISFRIWFLLRIQRCKVLKLLARYQKNITFETFLLLFR